MEPALLNELITTLKERFSKNMSRHTGIDWNSVQDRLEATSEKLQALSEMERIGGEPDVVMMRKPVSSFSMIAHLKVQ